MKSTIIIETPRLYLKEFSLQDASDMYQLNLDFEVIKYTGDVPFESVDEATSFIENYDHYKKYGFGRWSTFIKETDAYIGWCGLKQQDNGMIDIGFRFLKKCWNQGYATESAKACLDFGFQNLGMNHIVGRANSENEASIRVLEKLGMEFWKQEECGGLGNTVYYQIEK